MVFGLATRNVFKQTAKPFRIAQTITSLSSAVCPRVPTPVTVFNPSIRQSSSKSIIPSPEFPLVLLSEGGDDRKRKRWKPFPDGKWDTRTKLLVSVTGAGAVFYIYHLEQVEETGRWRFIIVSPEQARKYAEEADREVLKEFAGKILPPSDPLVRRITEIASRIITAADLGEVKGAYPSRKPGESSGWWPLLKVPTNKVSEGGRSDTAGGNKAAVQKDLAAHLTQEWEVYVIQDDEIPNAFVTGSGKIFVFTGIVSIAQTDDGLATVIGHEVAHQAQRHPAEQISSSRVIAALICLLAAWGCDIKTSHFWLTIFMVLPNSRAMESEADNIGLRLMAQACFDPRESVRCVPYSSRTLSPKKGRSPSRVQILATSIKLTEFLLSMWERMYEFEKDQDKGVFSFGKHDILRTHPATKQRIQDLQRWIPDALTVRKASMCSINDRLTVLDELRAFRDQLLAIKGGDWRGLGKRHLTMTQNSA